MVSQAEEKKPSIKVIKNGPYLVRDLKNFRNSKGVSIETKPVMALCRCGKSENKPFCDRAHSKNKPFCDGTHLQTKFKDEKN